MRFVGFKVNKAHKLGLLRGEEVFPVSRLGFDGDLLELIEASRPILEKLKNALADASNSASCGVLTELELTAIIPIPRRTIFCAGKNYADHAAEYSKSGYDKPGAEEVPDIPVTFFKLAECVVGPGESVDAQADVTQELDYEAELAAIIWSGGRGLTKPEAENAIFGYFLINDMTARDWQKGHDQWVVGKSFDGYCPMGSIVVTADEIISAKDLTFECFVNGEHRQSGDPSQLIFSVADLLQYFSRGITMMPGDIIATGSPLGPGIGFKPPKFLKAGDKVKITSNLMGTLETPIL